MGECSDCFASLAQLQELVFDSIPSALAHLKIEAMKSGWKISCNESLRATWVTFYCSKGGRSRGQKTTKTDCPWKITLGPGVVPGTVRVVKGHLTHNHPLAPDKYSIFTVDSQQQDMIRKMLEAGITPKYIQRFLERTGGPEFSSLQIRKLAGKRVTIDGPETEDLKMYMDSIGGICTRMETRQGQDLFVHAVFTATPFELQNLHQFGQVIWMDGTQKQNHLKWEIMPVTVIDQFKRIRSAGVFFVSRSDQEVIKWALRTLFSDDAFLSVLQTIITDEDSAFIPAFDSLMEEMNHGRPDDQKIRVSHVLCAFHKEQNYLKKVAKAGLTTVQRETAKDLFKIVCYSPSQQACDEALSSIEALSPKLASYVAKHIRPVLSKFARSYLCDVFTKGYNTTSPAESHNNMIKSVMVAGRVSTIRDMRMDITLAHRNAELCFRDKIQAAFQNQHFTLQVHNARFSPKIIADIDSTLQQALGLVCSDDMHVFHTDAPNYAYEVTHSSDDIYDCSCGRLRHYGLPCSHIIAAMKKEGRDYERDYPLRQISAVWWINDPADVLIPVDRNGQLTDDSLEGEAPVVSEDVFPNGNPLDDPTSDEQEFGERDVITLLTDKERFAQQKERYLTLFHLAKTIASIGSRSPEVSLKLHGNLQGMLNELLQIPETTSGAVSQAPSDDEAPIDDEGVSTRIVEVHDVSGRSRGRPKKRESPAEKFRKQRVCILCNREHRITECERYPAFAAAVEHNETEVPDTGHHRCSICSGIGHNRKKCPWVYVNIPK